MESLLNGIERAKVYVTRETSPTTAKRRRLNNNSPQCLETPLQTIQSASVPIQYKWGSSLPFCMQQCLSAVGTAIGMIVILLVARLISSNHVLEQDGQSFHICSSALRKWTTVPPCVACDTDMDDRPCCKSPQCYYSFRGALLVVSLVLTPIWACIFPIVAKGVLFFFINGVVEMKLPVSTAVTRLSWANLASNRKTTILIQVLFTMLRRPWSRRTIVLLVMLCAGYMAGPRWVKS